MRTSPLLLAGTCLVVGPALAIAGKKATAGDQSLQISALVQPAKAGKNVNLAFQVDYESLNDNAQIKENTKAVALLLPKGMKIHTSNRPTCALSVMLEENGSKNCPPNSLVGAGTGTADARPGGPILDAEIYAYNGIDDVNVDGTPRVPGTPALILEARTTIGVNTQLPFDILGRRLQLDFNEPGVGTQQPFHIQKVKLGIPVEKGKKPYVTAPRTCTGSWPFAMTITNYDGPSITAKHAVRCKRS